MVICRVGAIHTIDMDDVGATLVGIVARVCLLWSTPGRRELALFVTRPVSTVQDGTAVPFWAVSLASVIGPRPYQEHGTTAGRC